MSDMETVLYITDLHVGSHVQELAGVPIGHIAARCGMKSDSYLKRLFKQRMGTTLRDWRRRKLTTQAE